MSVWSGNRRFRQAGEDNPLSFLQTSDLKDSKWYGIWNGHGGFYECAENVGFGSNIDFFRLYLIYTPQQHSDGVLRHYEMDILGIWGSAGGLTVTIWETERNGKFWEFNAVTVGAVSEGKWTGDDVILGGERYEALNARFWRLAETIHVEIWGCVCGEITLEIRYSAICAAYNLWIERYAPLTRDPTPG